MHVLNTTRKLHRNHLKLTLANYFWSEYNYVVTSWTPLAGATFRIFIEYIIEVTDL